jgi:ABC-type multidrug transport system fused ATPase/permease subunit
MLNNIQNQFSDSEKERENNYTELINKLKEDYSSKAENNIQYLNDQINSKIDEMSKEIQTKTDQYYHEFDDILKQIQDKKKYAEDMVRALGNASITGQFQNTADSEKRFSNIFRGIALSLMIVSAVLAIWIIFSVVGKGEFEWQMIFFRIITVGILLIPAFYAAKESEKHREREVSNRKMQLELAALDPFLETLDEESQNQLKKDIANKIFGTQENFTNENVNLNVDNQTLISTIKQILQRSLQS